MQFTDSSPAKISEVDKGFFDLPRAMTLVVGKIVGKHVNSPFFTSSVLVGCFPQNRRKYSSPAVLDLIPL